MVEPGGIGNHCDCDIDYLIGIMILKTCQMNSLNFSINSSHADATGTAKSKIKINNIFFNLNNHTYIYY